MNYYNHIYDFLLEYLDENSEILDLACGPANISSYLKNKIDCKITGMDLSGEMLKIAQQNIPDGIFIKQSIIDFKLSEKFKLIVNGFGLPYLNIDQIIKSMQNSYNCLKSNGKMAYISPWD